MMKKHLRRCLIQGMDISLGKIIVISKNRRWNEIDIHIPQFGGNTYTRAEIKPKLSNYPHF
jgi:hypothetical protein